MELLVCFIFHLCKTVCTTMTYFSVVVLFFATVFATQIDEQVLVSIGQFLPVRWWLFENNTSSNSLRFIKYLSLNLQYTSRFPSITLSGNEKYDTLVVSQSTQLMEHYLLMDYPSGCSWLVLSRYTDDFLVQLPPLSTRIIFFEVNKGEVILTSVRRLCVNCLLETRNIKISALDQATYDQLHSFLSSDLNLGGAVVKVSVDTINDCESLFLNDPFDIIQCHHIEQIDLVGRIANFSARKILSPYINYEYNFPNNSLGGLYLQLRDRSADVSAGSWIITNRRLEILDLAWPTYQLEAVMFIKEGSVGVSWTAYIDPMNRDVWLAVATCITIGGGVLIIVTAFDHIVHEETPILAVYPFFHGLQIFSFQALNKMSTLASSRIAHYILFITAVALMPAYSGKIISYLTVHTVDVPFKNFQEFVNDGRYKMLTRSNHFIDRHFRDMSFGNNLLVPLEERARIDQNGFDQLCEGWLVYLVEAVLYRPVTHSYNCGVYELPITMMTEYFALALPKKSPLTHYLSVWNLHFRSMGLTNRLSRSMLIESKTNVEDKGFSAVTLNQTIPVFLFLLLSTLLAVMILFLEKYVIKKRWRCLPQLGAKRPVEKGAPVDLGITAQETLLI